MINPKYSKVIILDDGVELLLYLDFAIVGFDDAENTLYSIRFVCYKEDVIETVKLGKDTKENTLQKIADFTKDDAMLVSSNLLQSYK